MLEAQLVEHVGGSPSFAQRLLIDQVIRVRLQIDLFSERLAKGNWNDHDRRTYGALLTHFRLTLRELGIKPAEMNPSGIGEAEDNIINLIARHRGRRRNKA